jgi:hypothetical protein
MPVLFSSVLATEKIVAGLTLIDVTPEVRLLLAFFLCIIAISTLTFRFVLEE